MNLGEFKKLSLVEKEKEYLKLCKSISDEFEVSGVIPKTGASDDDILNSLYRWVQIYKEYRDNDNYHPLLKEIIID